MSDNMINYVPSIFVYHCGRKEEVLSFSKDEILIIPSIEDDIWLGNGMYFWDNESNAKYWYRNRTRKYPNDEFLIVKAILKLDKVLDLTSQDHINLCKKVMALLINKGIDQFDDSQLGKNINVLFTETDLFRNDFYTVKITGLYDWKDDNFITSNNTSKRNRPTTNAKTIYCVKKEEAIYLNNKEVI